MNNKGQTLVLFVILLPFLFIIISLVIDFGFLQIERNRIQNIARSIIRSELECNDCEKQGANERIEKIIRQDIRDVTIDKLDIKDDIIILSISKKYKSIFSNILKSKVYEINLSYRGFITDNKVIIKRE